MAAPARAMAVATAKAVAVATATAMAMAMAIAVAMKQTAWRHASTPGAGASPEIRPKQIIPYQRSDQARAPNFDSTPAFGFNK